MVIIDLPAIKIIDENKNFLWRNWKFEFTKLRFSRKVFRTRKTRFGGTPYSCEPPHLLHWDCKSYTRGQFLLEYSRIFQIQLNSNEYLCLISL